MRDLFLDAVEAAAELVEQGAKLFRESITEGRNAFSDDEAGDYLRCAGADALADCGLGFHATASADFPAAESGDPAGDLPPAPAGSPTSELLAGAAQVIEVCTATVMTGTKPAVWVGDFLAELRDRGAQFAAHDD